METKQYRKAILEDLKLELWLRQRNYGSIYHVGKSGKTPIKDMNIKHLINTVELLTEREEEDCS